MLPASSLVFVGLLACLWLAAVAPVCGQAREEAPADTVRWEVVTKDGNRYYGTILSQDQTILRLRTDQLGQVDIPVGQIRSMEPATGQGRGEAPMHLLSTRYFLLPNALGLRRGEGYYQNAGLSYNQVNFGITNNFELGGGAFLFLPALWITPKLSVPLAPRLHLGVGAWVGAFLINLNGGAPVFGLAYTNLTAGTRNANLTAGLGFGFAGGDLARVPVVQVGGLLRVAPKWYLMAENYLLLAEGSGGALLLPGARYVGRTISLDGGLLVPALVIGGDTGFLLALPWFSLSVMID